MISSAVFLIFIILGLTYYYFKCKFRYWKDRDVPFVQPSIPYGNLQGRTRKIHAAEFFTKLYNQLKGKSPFGGLYLFTSSAVLATDLDFIQNIMVKDFQYFQDRGVYYNEKDDPISTHLVSVDGEKWKTLRAKMTPTFSIAKLKMMIPTILEVGEHLKAALTYTTKNNSEIEVKDLLARFTTDIIGSCAFGLECNCLNDPNTEFLKMIQKVFSIDKNKYWKHMMTLVFPDFSRKLGIKNTKDDVAEFFMNIVKEIEDHRESTQEIRPDFMNLLLQLKKSGDLTFNEVAAEAFVFIAAGYETSSTTLTYIIFELAQNPDVQNHARQHIQEVLKKNDGNITYESLANMDYLEQCIYEALRKYPPVPVLIRKCIADYAVPNTNLIIEKGQTILFPVFSIHHDIEYFPEPEKYNPDRFLPGEVKKRHPLAFLPFGAGPRNCIGFRFAMLEMKIGLAILLTNFKFVKNSKTPSPLIFAKTDLILAAEGGVYVNVEKIE